MADQEKPTVRDYMTQDVATVAPEDTVRDVAERIAQSDNHSGYPVCDGRHVEGFISARDLLLEDESEPIFKVMSTDLLVAHPDMKLNDAARVILRSGIRRLPVVDDAGNLVGIISNSDVIRSQIERATPDKVNKLVKTLENIHDIDATESRRNVVISELTPTQGKVYADELEGRRYELQRGLAEPLVIIDTPTELLLADGHHRVKAASQLGIDEMDAYVIEIEAPVELGMAETARKENLETVDDIDAVDYAHHPLVERTQRLQE
ncbi:CBS domain-containing protein [Halovenus halobia]|uniref:CBS domain-containing protein n=1 Tax=Halovenus halobia TaxID=3396622 RepID=UPI003F56D760